MFGKALILAFVAALTLSAAGPGVSFQGDACPGNPAQLRAGDVATVSISEAEHLNLRVEPGLDQEIILGIPKDALVTVAAGPVCRDGYRWYKVDYQGWVGWSVEAGPEGYYSLFPIGTPLIEQNPQSTEQSQPTQGEVPSAQFEIVPEPAGQSQPAEGDTDGAQFEIVPEPVDEPQSPPVQQFWCGALPFFCPEDNRVHTWDFEKYQCTWYAAVKRPDSYDWLPLYGANAKDWADIAIQNQVFVDSGYELGFVADYDHVRAGDLVVLQPGCAGADMNYGHIAYVEYVDYVNGSIHISEYNAVYVADYSERDLPINWCMSFIH